MKNTKKNEYFKNGTWLFHEIKKYIKLCLKDDSFRCYHFLAEVTLTELTIRNYICVKGIMTDAWIGKLQHVSEVQYNPGKLDTV